jgi:hypothetical protein
LARFAEMKSFSVKSHFPVPVHLPYIQILDNIGSTVYFLGNFFQVIICSWPSTDVPGFVEKYPKNKICHF